MRFLFQISREFRLIIGKLKNKDRDHISVSSERERAKKITDLMMNRYDETLRALHDR